MSIELLAMIVLTAVFAGGYGIGFRHGYEAGEENYERKLR